MLNFSNTLSNVGGKAFSLMQLKQHKLNVPAFFVVPTDIFFEFIKFNNLEHEIKTLYKQNKLEKISQLILNGEFPKDTANWIFAEFEKLNSSKVSVRSSAVIEDSKTHSCAGQFQTFLNVTKRGLLENIKCCFASLYSQTVKTYINNYSKINKGIAVVVQKMINSKYSGVAFSTDYNFDNNKYMIIEAVKGLGESLVSGQVTPSKYYVRKSNLSLDKVVNEKHKIYHLINQLAKNVIQIENAYKMPMDIEWAVDENDEIYILQARPIVSFNFNRVYQYTFSRPRCLFEEDLNNMIYTIGLKSISNNLFYLEPILIFDSKVYKEYSNITNLDEDPFVLVRYAINNNLLTIKEANKAIKACDYVNKHITDKSVNLNKIINNYLTYEAYNLISNFFINDNTLKQININGLDKKVYNQLINNRDYFDSTNDKVFDYIKNIAKSYLLKDYEEQYKFLRLNEILNCKKLSKSELAKRKNGFILFNTKLILKTQEKDIKKWASENNIILNDTKKSNDDKNTIKGEVAYHGLVSGKVKIVYNEDDFLKVEKGDIIVSPMTIPSFMPILKKASAIITDDGGTVCHAALIARELKLPCLVGTLDATTKLKDGDMVELNTAISSAKKQ